MKLISTPEVAGPPYPSRNFHLRIKENERNKKSSLSGLKALQDSPKLIMRRGEERILSLAGDSYSQNFFRCAIILMSTSVTVEHQTTFIEQPVCNRHYDLLTLGSVSSSIKLEIARPSSQNYYSV